MTKLQLYVGQDYYGRHTHKRLDLDAIYSMEGDGSFRGRIVNQSPEQLFDLWIASRRFDVFAFLKARRYKVTELTREGDFTAVPDFRIASVEPQIHYLGPVRFPRISSCSRRSFEAPFTLGKPEQLSGQMVCVRLP
jgi:hypothetical protein